MSNDFGLRDYQREELAWAAGFFDGEGCVSCRGRTGHEHERIYLTIAQVDRRVLDRFAAAVGTGTVRGPYQPKTERSRPYFLFQGGGAVNVQTIMGAIWPWLSEVKRRQYEVAFANFTAQIRNRPGRPPFSNSANAIYSRAWRLRKKAVA